MYHATSCIKCIPPRGGCGKGGPGIRTNSGARLSTFLFATAAAYTHSLEDTYPFPYHTRICIPARCFTKCTYYARVLTTLVEKRENQFFFRPGNCAVLRRDSTIACFTIKHSRKKREKSKKKRRIMPRRISSNYFKNRYYLLTAHNVFFMDILCVIETRW